MSRYSTEISLVIVGFWALIYAAVKVQYAVRALLGDGWWQVLIATALMVGLQMAVTSAWANGMLVHLGKEPMKFGRGLRQAWKYLRHK